MQNPDFQHRYGPWAVVTGASDGMGEALACELAQRGLNLVLVARRDDRLKALASQLQTAWGIETAAVATDLAKPHGNAPQRADMQMTQVAAPDVVARETLNALGHRAVVRPGWLSKLLGWSLATAPRAVRVEIMSKVMQGMLPAGRERA